MDERTSQIVEEIVEERQRLGDNIAELERKVRDSTSWRVYFERRPWAALGVALGGGLLLSALLPPFFPRAR
jgi:ElaB/YqjD/DUF883 family membrane-anchored ribosome-binding protein